MIICITTSFVYATCTKHNLNTGKMSSKFPRNSEGSILMFLANREDVFPRYCTHSDIKSKLNYSTELYCAKGSRNYLFKEDK